MSDDIIAVAPIGAVSARSPSHDRSLRHAHGYPHGAPSHQQQDSSDISLSAGDQAQNLLYCAVLDQICQLLHTSAVANPRQQPAAQLASYSQHLLHGIAALFPGFRQQHPEHSASQQLQTFIQLAQAGFENGYRETCDILQQLKVLHPLILAELENTRQQTLLLLQHFDITAD